MRNTILKSRFARLAVCAAVCLAAAQVRAAVVWNESTNGDLSTTPTSPTQLNVSLGVNSVLATMPGDDLDFLTILLPAGTQLSQVVQISFVSDDQVGFIAVGPGTQLPAGILGYDPTGLLGYTHWGPGYFPNGDDILPYIGQENFGVPGFTPPLTGTAYSFWIQQESTVDVAYQLDFVVTTAVPEPALCSLLVIVSFWWGIGRCRTR